MVHIAIPPATKLSNSGKAKVKIVKKERDPPLFTSKQLINF
jgi:hypothetical protein